MRPGSELSVDEIVAVLASGAARPLSPGQPVTQLGHALQTAAILRREEPDDVELAVAGLVHDLGQLLPGAGDETHAVEGASAVRAALGERVAGIVALHVEAKRYLVATDSNYKVRLAADSVLSLGGQGGALTAGEAVAFLARPWAREAITLRRADDRAKVEGLGVDGLDEWVPLLVRLCEGGRRRPTRTTRRSGQLTTVTAPGTDVRGGILRGVWTGDERRERWVSPRSGVAVLVAAAGRGEWLAWGFAGPATGKRPGGTGVAGPRARRVRTAESRP